MSFVVLLFYMLKIRVYFHKNKMKKLYIALRTEALLQEILELSAPCLPTSYPFVIWMFLMESNSFLKVKLILIYRCNLI